MCRQLLTALVVGVVVVGALEMGGAEGKPDPTQLAAMADAIKYLHELDKYYSPVSRPSTRSAPGPASHIQALEKTLKFLQLQELGKIYSHMTRPRFGKRSETVLPPGDTLVSVRNQQMEASERLLETLARRR